ncbi:hypothetical protein HI914_01120 [Erysiphe necator]|uniref:Cardiolipin synthase N-terminal domain-containing protein n=1 Tax=Uncinula necator TaxID=52586 RepID=A0A0B1NVT5_UNCNE|nr:hypothetical protein HI914_01120 [Erysiphe necator]KHJ30477.1 hypothetical protein EV44_g0047 [Erysiphe necator]
MTNLLHSKLLFFLQLYLTSISVAAPTLIAADISGASPGDALKYGSGGSLVGFIVLILDIIVFIEVLKSDRLVSHKLLWCVVVFLFPIFGLIIYWLFSHRDAYSRSSGYESIG